MGTDENPGVWGSKLHGGSKNSAGFLAHKWIPTNNGNIDYETWFTSENHWTSHHLRLYILPMNFRSANFTFLLPQNSLACQGALSEPEDPMSEMEEPHLTSNGDATLDRAKNGKHIRTLVTRSMKQFSSNTNILTWLLRSSLPLWLENHSFSTCHPAWDDINWS